MRDSAIWLGRERNWVNQAMSDRTILSPCCKQQIPEDAYVCFHCGTKIRRFPKEIESLNVPSVGADMTESIATKTAQPA
jgi:hypothetical protein